MKWRDLLRKLQNSPNSLLDDDIVVYTEFNEELFTRVSLQQNTEDKDDYEILNHNQLYLTVRS